MKIFFYRLWQCTWGILQTIVGFVLFLTHIKEKHYSYHGAIVTVWESSVSISLGLFVFVSRVSFYTKKFEEQLSEQEIYDRTLVHEYGHTIQSLILGPLYLFIIGISSSLWGFLFAKMRREKQIPYGAFFSEKWANALGEYVIKENSLGNLVID